MNDDKAKGPNFPITITTNPAMPDNMMVVSTGKPGGSGGITVGSGDWWRTYNDMVGGKSAVEFTCDGCGKAILDRGIVIPAEHLCFCNTDCETKYRFDRMEDELNGKPKIHITSFTAS